MPAAYRNDFTAEQFMELISRRFGFRSLMVLSGNRFRPLVAAGHLCAQVGGDKAFSNAAFPAGDSVNAGHDGSGLRLRVLFRGVGRIISLQG